MSSGGLLLALAACGGAPEVQRKAAADCASCHPAEAAAWRTSTHAGALRPAVEALAGAPDGRVVSGDTTTSVTVREDGVRLTLTREDHTEQLVAAWAIGVNPVVQLLVERPGGRWQVPDLAFDVRAAAEGGQRWLTLGDAASARPGDALHWDGPAFTANAMCLACHTTGFAKGWDEAGQAFHTTWEAPGVGCASCHGDLPPDHDEAGVGPPDAGRGDWAFAAGARIAHRATPPPPAAVGTCAPCHAHASPIDDPPSAPGQGGTLAESHRLTLLDAPWYRADGAVHGEVFEVGPFLRSKMHAAGVTCGDCHEPHTGATRAPGDALCTTCHLDSAYATPAHHHHEAGAGCVDCHMPAVTFMAVDVRHDHGLYVPRPDRAAVTGAASACGICHAGLPEAALAEAAQRWWGTPAPGWTDLLASGSADAVGRLLADPSAPAIVRATALGRPGAPPAAVIAGLDDPDPLVRRAAVDALAVAPATLRVALLPRRLDDVRSVAFSAALALADARGELPPGERALLDRVVDALRGQLRADGHAPEAKVQACRLHAALGEGDAALEACRDAVARAPWQVAARVELAEVLRALGREAEAERALRDGLDRGDDADLRHALGLSLVRQGRRVEGVEELLAAHRLRPADPELAYVTAVGLAELGRGVDAKAVMETTGALVPWGAEVDAWAAGLGGP